MKTSILLFLNIVFIIFPLFIKGQALLINGELNSSSNVNRNGNIPFWLFVNQLGTIQQKGKFIQSGELLINMQYQFKNGNFMFIKSRLNGSKGISNYFAATELYGGFKLGKFLVHAGSYADSIQLSGLFSSNGNLLNSRNARPYPSISLNTNGFIRIGKRNFCVAGKWEEGVLLGNRIIDKPWLHHKNLFLRWDKPGRLQFTFGIDHYAFWGGTSVLSGSQPAGFSDYLRAVLAMKGGENATLSDQANVAGNSLGQYFFMFKKSWEKIDGEFRITHPFEDKSGMVLFNGLDNLYGVFLTFKEPGLLKHALIEFMYTKNQSGDDKRTPEGAYIHTNGHDSYLNHGFYRSGFTNYGRVMGSPFFSPLKYNEEGISEGVLNNRIMAFHFGFDGAVSTAITWKTLLSYSENYGTYSKPFDQVRKQFSGLIELGYQSPEIPFYVITDFAFDRGTNLNEGINRINSGVRIKLGKKF
jgi:hypothetical protein